MKILITGCDGQLGKTLYKAIKDGKSELGTIPSQLLESKIITTDLPELDITKLSSVFSFMKYHHPDIIINCAAYTAVDKCETDQDTAMAVNALGPRNLAIAAKATHSKFVHISTDYVFDGANEKAKSEWDLPNPQSIYGCSKLLGEKYVQQLCPQSFIIRTAWLYGLVGGNFVKTVLKLAKDKGSVKVVNDQFGNPTYTEDLAHHILKLAASEEYGLYHCTNGGVCSWYDFAEYFFSLSGVPCVIVPCKTEEFPQLASRPHYSALENRMLRLTVGNEMRSWQDAIKSFMTHYDIESGEFQ